MKNVLLYALSILLISGNSPAFAQNRESSAGQATPVRLGGEDRSPKPRTQTVPVAKPAASDKGAGSPAATTGNVTGAPGKPAAKVKGGLIPPPPPDIVSGAMIPGKRRAKRRIQVGPGGAPVEKLVVVGQGGPYRFSGKTKEEFTQTFMWNPDDRADNLTLKANFSPLQGPNPKFIWLRVMIGNRLLATEQTLKNKTSFTLDLTNGVENGLNQIVVDGSGTPGATFDFKLTTPRKVKLTAVNPDEVVVGQDLTLKGENFDPAPSKDTITLGKKQFPANTATGTTELKLRIPANFEPGEYLVKVSVDGLSSKELKVTVRGIPELTGTNLNGVPPGAQLVIYGKNFSKKLGENSVRFDNTQAEVVACTTEQLTVVVPNFYTGLEGDTAGVAGQVGIPIRVKVGKIESKNTVPINVGNSTWMDPGLQTGPNIPTVPVDWRRLLEN